MKSATPGKSPFRSRSLTALQQQSFTRCRVSAVSIFAVTALFLMAEIVWRSTVIGPPKGGTVAERGLLLQDGSQLQVMLARFKDYWALPPGKQLEPISSSGNSSDSTNTETEILLHGEGAVQRPPASEEAGPTVEEVVSPFWDTDLLERDDAFGGEMEPCWRVRLPKSSKSSAGHVLITCSGGAEQHRIQIADAAAVAYQLGASLVLPKIREAERQPKSSFHEMYAASHFIRSLSGFINVIDSLPAGTLSSPDDVVSLTVPTDVTSEYIERVIRPLSGPSFVLSLGSFGPAENRSLDANDSLNALRCLVNYEALRFGPEITKLGKRMVARMREADQTAGGRFVAVDVQLAMSKKRRKLCANTKESLAGMEGNVTEEVRAKQRWKDWECPLVAEDVEKFLRLRGAPPETAVYITQQRWDPAWDPLRQSYPNLLTKEYTIPLLEEQQLQPSKTILEAMLDLFVCFASDVFIPAAPGKFREAVIGHRLYFNHSRILFPTSLSLLEDRQLLTSEQETELLLQLSRSNQRLPIEGEIPSSPATVYSRPQHFCLCPCTVPPAGASGVVEG
eukprot:TRINITY_DN21986_c0_g1_i1.p1 TRINITY_DN21986_c0_g1~~TRINITY_DN21986_c0_g1_i1.p1  ORF type:complete len:564 (-),score=98.20 TRINITY_DN21986_c0_g1_i1:186-1877(-)